MKDEGYSRRDTAAACMLHPDKNKYHFPPPPHPPSTSSSQDVRREVQVNLHLAGHPNVCNLRETYEDRESIHL